MFQTVRNKVIGLLLHYANTHPHTLARREFYALKTRLLERFGTFKGVDVQHILKECYSCEKGCRKCNYYGKGGGVWDEFWSFLEIRELGGYRFHIPRRKVYQKPDEAVTVEGYITHSYPRYYLYSECFYWLALMFDRPLFWGTFGHSGHVSRKFTPMVWAATLLFYYRYPESQLRHWKLKVKRWAQRLKPQGLIVLNLAPPDDDDIPF